MGYLVKHSKTPFLFYGAMPYALPDCCCRRIFLLAGSQTFYVARVLHLFLFPPCPGVVGPTCRGFDRVLHMSSVLGLLVWTHDNTQAGRIPTSGGPQLLPHLCKPLGRHHDTPTNSPVGRARGQSQRAWGGTMIKLT